MASVQNTTSYVKFVRGTIAAWEVLKRENQVKDDTLYFIYESTTSDKGLLYLGTKQIGGTLNGDKTIPEVLDDLKDVIINQTELNIDNILVYNGSEWINAPFIDLLKYDGNVLDLNGDGALTLRGFEESEVGAIPQKDDSGLITWIKPGNLPEITEMAEQLGEVYSLIASMDHLSYKKVESLDDINVNADKAANYIYLVPTEDNTNKYNEYMVIDNTLEPVGTWDVNLENYVTSDTFQTVFDEFDDAISKNAEDIKDLNSSLTSINGELGGLKETINGVGSDLSDLSRVVNTFMGEVGNLEDLVLTEELETLVDQVNYLTQQLTWQEIVED